MFTQQEEDALRIKLEISKLGQQEDVLSKTYIDVIAEIQNKARDDVDVLKNQYEIDLANIRANKTAKELELKGILLKG